MKNKRLPFLLCALAMAQPFHALCQVTAATETKPIDSELLVSEQLKLLRALPPVPDFAMPADPEPELSAGLIADRAGKMLKLLDRADEDQAFEADSSCEKDVLGRPSALCGVRWRKSDAFSDLRSRYETVNRGVKSSLFGKGLARHIELDLDTSPEIKFEFKFD